LRHAVGLRPLDSAAAGPAVKAGKAAAPGFKQYREKDGQFYFKLVDAQGGLLLQSTGFASPRDAAQTITQLQQQGPAALAGLQDRLSHQGDPAELDAALRHFSESTP
jgi:tryptophanyl-tRNA synthetase